MATQTKSVYQEKKELQARLKEIESQIPVVSNKDFGVTVKVGEKGSLNFYGLNKKFPICLYKTQLEKILKLADTKEFQDFLAANADKISQGKKEE